MAIDSVDSVDNVEDPAPQAQTASATGFALTGPGTGTVGNALTFTLTPVGGALAAAETVVVTDDLGNTVGTLNFAQGATAGQTFGYTPGTAGSRTLTGAASPALGANATAGVTVASGISVPAAPGQATGNVSLIISWGALPSGAAAFRLYKDGGGTPIYTGTNTSYTDTVAAGSNHTYSVSAYNTAGESAQTPLMVAGSGSSSASAPVYAPGAFVPLLDSSILNVAGSATLNWAADPFAASYTVLQTVDGSGPAVLQAGITALTYTDNAKPAGKVRYFVQIAYQ